MKEHLKGIADVSSDKVSYENTMTHDNDNGTLLNGSVKAKVPGMLHHDGQHVRKELFESDGDIKLWLEHTGFFDIEYRWKVLDGLRKLKAIDEQRSEILLQIQNTAGAMIMPNISHNRQDSIVSSSYSSLSTLPSSLGKQTASTGSPHRYCNGCVSKAVLMANESHESQSPVVYNNGLDSADGFAGPRGRRMTDQRDDVRPAFSHDYGRDRSIAVASSSQVENETCRSDVSYNTSVSVPQMPSRMNDKPEARYFLVKSFNVLNVEMSQRDGLWITKAKNGPTFIEAFNQCKTVILFFSINKSKAFQGYARMITAPRPEIAKAEWMGNIDWETSDPFRIEWLNTRRVDFWKVGDLRNPLNDDAPVFVGRDGQEYPEDCGRKIMEVMDRSVEKRYDGPSWTVSHLWGNADKERCDSREGSRRGDRPNWREMMPSTNDTTVNKNGAESCHSMTLIDY